MKGLQPLYLTGAFLLLMGVGSVSSGPAALKIRPDHPRMLLNADDLGAIRKRTRTTHKDSWRQAKEWIDGKLGQAPADNWQSAEVARTMAFVHLVTGENRYAREAVRWLRHTAGYQLRKAKGGTSGSNWEMVGLRRANYVAYDWLFNAMTKEERMEIGGILLAISDAHVRTDTWHPAYAGGYNRFDNDFFCGVALHRSGVDDAKAAEYLKGGHEFLATQTLPGRCQVASDDGGIQSGMGYAFYNYIPVEAYYLSILKSAAGLDRFAEDSSLANFGVWAKYTITPNGDYPPICDIATPGRVLTADTLDGTSRASVNGQRLYFSLIAKMYRDGRTAAMVPEPGRYWVFQCVNDILWRDLSVRPVIDDKSLPRGRHFEGLGWVGMRSGWEEDATWSIFTCGDYYYGHNHFDVNSFVIYHRGYLAADARQRIYETTGHNTFLVHADDGDGGQRPPKGDRMVRFRPEGPDAANDMGDITAFETNDCFVYACGDGTKAYSWSGRDEYVAGRERKKYVSQLRGFTRQYLFLLPRTFVVFDRLKAAQPRSKKVWQLHSWTEPEVSEEGFVIHHGEGMLEGFTVLPEKSLIQKDYQKLTGAENTKSELWRVTVEAEKPGAEERFLHVLHATDADRPRKAKVKKIEKGSMTGVRIEADGHTYSVLFRLKGKTGGTITVRKGSRTLVDRKLTTEVQPQAGWATD